MSGELEVAQSPQDQGSREVVPREFDFSQFLATGETVQSATSRLVDMNNGSDYSSTGLVGGPVLLSASVVSQVVANLVPGRSYRLECDGHIQVDKVITQAWVLACPY